MKLLKETLGKLKMGAGMNFKKDGFVAPVLFSNLDGQLTITPLEIEGSFSKEMLSQIIVTLIKEKNLQEFVFLTEAWMAVGEEAIEHNRKGGSLEHVEGRMEIVTMHYASPDEEIMNNAEIVRPKSGEPYLKDWKENIMSDEDMVKLSKHKTRFNNLWKVAEEETIKN